MLLGLSPGFVPDYSAGMCVCVRVRESRQGEGADLPDQTGATIRPALT